MQGLSQALRGMALLRGLAGVAVLIIRAGYLTERAIAVSRTMKSTILDLEGAFFSGSGEPILDRP
ncbi:hypothetical protein J3P91_13405 [Pseudomonas sp. Z4-7]|uniref:hypothetical protein n=1 Tax=Pseudomonas sp. Z4-7 TaxID=2817413 RepID=UPI003DA9C904